MSVLATPDVVQGSVIPSRPAGLARRLLVPSFTDWFFVALLVWLFMAGPYGWSGLLSDGDVGWHIRTGQYILNTHSVPRIDLFSFSRAGAPWFAWEWLADVVFALLYGAAGLKGIVLFAGVMIAAFGALLVRYMVWRGANGLIAALVCLIAVGASTIHFLARPHLFTLLFFVAALWVLAADHAVWLLIPLTVLWTNLHGGFAVLFVVLGIYMAGALLEAQWKRAGKYGLLFLGCAGATLVNPCGWGLHRHLIEYLRSDWIRNVVQEFQAPTFRSENQAQFEILLLAGILAAGACMRRGALTQVLLVLGFAHLSLTSARHIPLYAVAAAPVIAVEATRLWSAWVAASRPKSVVRILGAVAGGASADFGRWSLFAPLAVVLIAVVPGIAKWPTDFPKQMFPVAMISANAQRVAGTRTLTTDQWADYLLFRFWPGTKVFVDGRTDFYGPRIGGEYIDLWHGQGRWKALLDRYRFETALIPPDWPLCTLLQQDTGWHRIAGDKQAVLFARTSPIASGPEDIVRSGTTATKASERGVPGVLRNRGGRP